MDEISYCIDLSLIFCPMRIPKLQIKGQEGHLTMYGLYSIKRPSHN